MPTAAEIGLQRWHEVVASRDAGKLPGLIAEDAVFRSPAVHTPQEGRDLVTAYLSGAFAVLGPELTYHEEWVGEADAVLRFTTVVDGLQVEGIDLIRWDEECRIVEFTVMLRPFTALQAVMAGMLEQLTRRS
jgi:hypothetical protein